MKDKLLIGILGVKGAGKSYTWKKLFGRDIRTGKNLRKLYLTENEFIEVFLVNGSAEERKKAIDDIIVQKEPRIILSSFEYSKDVLNSLEYFFKGDYQIFFHWLNPGYHDEDMTSLFYTLGVINTLLKNNSMVGIRNGKTGLNERVEEIRSFLYGWSISRGLLESDNDE